MREKHKYFHGQYMGSDIPNTPNTRKSMEEKREEARQAIEPFLKPTTGRWPIYHGPREIDTSGCRVAVIRTYGTFDFRWESYKQCRLEPQISKDEILYCRVHDPDKKWPRINKTFRNRMNTFKVEIPETITSKKKREKIEYRKSSDSPNLFRKLVNRFR